MIDQWQPIAPVSVFRLEQRLARHLGRRKLRHPRAWGCDCAFIDAANGVEIGLPFIGRAVAQFEQCTPQFARQPVAALQGRPAVFGDVVAEIGLGQHRQSATDLVGIGQHIVRQRRNAA